ncbi:MAG: phage tail length tape measure family protein [Reyranella sp.]|uniref:phage tail length tape measure family protein n=1 Tax=Reyranella sp. TaxID=1929291 RepID=UPI003D0E4F6C
MNEAVRRLTIVSEERGVRQTATALMALGAAEDAVAVAAQKQERATTLSSAALERKLARLDPLVRAQRDYRTALETASRYEEHAIGTAEQRARYLELETARYQKQIDTINRLAAARKAAAQNTVDQATITPDRAADVAAYGAELDRLRAKYNPLWAAGRQYKATLDEINMATRTGAITERERTAAIERTKAAFAAQVGALNSVASANALAAGSARLNTFQMQNMAMQMNDIGVMLASGQSPFVLLMQQGMQISQLFNPGTGLGAAFKSVGAGLLAFVTNPLNLAVLGLATAAGAVAYFWDSITGGGQDAESTLEEVRSLIDDVKNSFSEASEEARRFSQTRPAEQQVMALQKYVALTEQIIEAQRKFAGGSDMLFSLGVGGVNVGVQNPFANLNVPVGFVEQVEAYRKAVAAGRQDTEAFVEQLARLAIEYPTTESLDFVAATIKALQPTLDLEDAQEKLAATLRVMAGQATEADAAILGLTGKITSAAIATAEIRRGLLMLGAGGGTRIEYDEGLKARFADAYGEKYEPPKPTKTETDATRRQKSFDDALAATQKQTEALRIQADTFGMTEAAAAEYQKRQELINLARANGIALSDGTVAAIDREAAAYGKATSELQRMRDAQEAQDFLARSLFDAVKGADSLADAFGRLATKIGEAALEALLLGSGPLAGLLGLGGGGGIFGSLFGALLGGVRHQGGVVGAPGGPSRMVHPAYFDNAPRFRTGGIAGFGPDEVPIIAHRSEEIVRRDDPRHRANGGAMGQTINVSLAVNFGDASSAEAVAVLGARVAQLQRSMPEIVKGVFVEAKSTAGWIR